MDAPLFDQDLRLLQRKEDFPVEHAEHTTVVRSVHDEVVGPGVVPVLRATTNTGSVIQPQATPFRLLVRYFQPVATPDAPHPLVVDVPALLTE